MHEIVLDATYACCEIHFINSQPQLKLSSLITNYAIFCCFMLIVADFFRSISGNRIKYIPGGLLQKTPGIAHLELKGNPFVAVDSHAFSFLPRLRKLQVLYSNINKNSSNKNKNIIVGDSRNFYSY